MTTNVFNRNTSPAEMKIRNASLRLAIATATSIALMACGGGGSGGSGGGSGDTESVDSTDVPATRSSRVASFRAHLDSNDVADEAFDIDYDATGLVTGITRQVEDDREPNTANFYSDGSASLLRTELVYDSSNRLTSSVTTNTDVDGTETYETMQTYEDGLLKRIDETYSYSAGSSTSSVELFYTERKLTQYIESDGPDRTAFNVIYAVEHDAEGRVSALQRSYQDEVEERHEFTWRADDQLEIIHSTEGVTSATLEFSYDTAGVLQFTRHTLVDGLGGSTSGGAEFDEIAGETNYTLYRDYDNRGRVSGMKIDKLSDGIIDGTVEFEWEDGACIPFFELVPEGLPEYIRSADVPYEPGSGIVAYPYCSEK